MKSPLLHKQFQGTYIHLIVRILLQRPDRTVKSVALFIELSGEDKTLQIIWEKVLTNIFYILCPPVLWLIYKQPLRPLAEAKPQLSNLLAKNITHFLTMICAWLSLAWSVYENVILKNHQE